LGSLWGGDRVLVRADRGQPPYFVSQVQDISERKALASRLEYLLDHDFLTGLFNRRRFQQELANEAERVSRYGANAAVLMIDLDNFKDVNDGFGHKAGDDLLKGVAGALKSRAGPTSRAGGRRRIRHAAPETDTDQAETPKGIQSPAGRSPCSASSRFTSRPAWGRPVRRSERRELIRRSRDVRPSKRVGIGLRCQPGGGTAS
jgi:hypothetical protein